MIVSVFETNLKKAFKSLAGQCLILLTVLFFVGSSLSLAQGSFSETALAFDDIIGPTFFIDSFNSNDNLSVGFIHLQSQAESILSDGEAKVSLANLISDSWGYTEEGFEVSLANTSDSFTVNGINEASTDLSLSSSYFQSLDSLTGLSFSETLGLSGFTEFSLQASYSSTETTSPFSALGSIGYRQSFDTQLPLITNNVRIERISVEPTVSAWFDSDISFGADIAVSADTSLFNTSNLSLGLEGGYTDGFWYNFTINSPVKF